MFFIGVDLGQRRDHTAIAVVERLAGDRLLLRHVERVLLGTPYPRVVDRVAAILREVELLGRCVLAVDATGVGAPVVDLLRAAGLGCEIAAVTITGGERESQAGDAWSVPKRDLIAGVQVALEQGELKIARGMREAGAMVRELVDMRMNGKAMNGEHDDLVIALALGCWRAKKGERDKGTIGFGKRRLF